MAPESATADVEPREGCDVELLALIANPVLPRPASPRLRQTVPTGYGVQEQCLPFTAATALGLLIVSPITFGICAEAELPASARAFRCPLEAATAQRDPRVYYILDDPERSFANNAFVMPSPGLGGMGDRTSPFRFTPGISFFERPDQAELFKLHLPYILRTPPGANLLFVPAINRPGTGLTVLCGVVETDWYGHPVNLVLRKPATASVHIRAGDPIAQAITVRRDDRPTELTVLPQDSPSARNLREDLAEWYRQHARDRSAYKRIARSRRGGCEEREQPTPSYCP